MTGGNKGIGFETAKKLCLELKDQDAVVILTSRCPQKGKEAIEKLEAEGLTASLEQLDIQDGESVKRFVETLKQKYGEVACLINNAGFAFKSSATEPVGTQASVTCAINYYGTRDLTMAMCPLFKAGSRIVNVASGSGRRALEQMNAERRHRLMNKKATISDIDQVTAEYLAACDKEDLEGWPKTTYGFSKAAVIALTAACARMCDACPGLQNGKEIIITCCCPGWCKSDMAGWQDPPRSTSDGADVIVPLALRAGKEHHGKFVDVSEIMDLRED